MTSVPGPGGFGSGGASRIVELIVTGGGGGGGGGKPSPPPLAFGFSRRDAGGRAAVFFFAGARFAAFLRAGARRAADFFFVPPLLAPVFFLAPDFLPDDLRADFLDDFRAVDLRLLVFFAVFLRVAFFAVFLLLALRAAMGALLGLKNHFPATTRSPRSAASLSLNCVAIPSSESAAAAAARSSRLAGTYSRYMEGHAVSKTLATLTAFR